MYGESDDGDMMWGSLYGREPEEVVFENMSCVRISDRNQSEKLGIIETKEGDCECGKHHGTNKNCSFCNQFAEQH